MDRREAILRELNLYPQWELRGRPAPRVGIPLPVKAGAGSTPLAGTEIAVNAMPATSVAEDPAAAVAEESGSLASERPSVSIPPVDVLGGGNLDWPELKQRVRACNACRLRAGCTQTVFGVGDEKADWLFVGEGPGADEDAQGEPFVGQAGKLLDNMLVAIGLKRGKNVYIANIVKCRPPGNRNPEADEIAQCMPYLQRQIELIQPKMIVALGKVASNALLGRDATLASLRGKVHDYRVATATGSDEMTQEGESSHLSSIPHQTTSSHRVGVSIPLIVTYHPAYLLRSPTEKAKAWQDLLLAVKTRNGGA
jgi:uracil-DNA glycosylase